MSIQTLISSTWFTFLAVCLYIGDTNNTLHGETLNTFIAICVFGTIAILLLCKGITKVQATVKPTVAIKRTEPTVVSSKVSRFIDRATIAEDAKQEAHDTEVALIAVKAQIKLKEDKAKLAELQAKLNSM